VRICDYDFDYDNDNEGRRSRNFRGEARVQRREHAETGLGPIPNRFALEGDTPAAGLALRAVSSCPRPVDSSRSADAVYSQQGFQRGAVAENVLPGVQPIGRYSAHQAAQRAQVRLCPVRRPAGKQNAAGR